MNNARTWSKNFKIAFVFVCVMVGAAAPVFGDEPTEVRSEPERERQPRPNVYFSINQRAISFIVERVVEQTSGIRETIMGANVTGLARTKGRISSSLVPNSNHAVFEISLNANIRSDTVGSRRSITVRSGIETRVSASQQVFVSDEGMKSRPATASAATDSVSNRVDARCRLVKRLAQKKVDRMSPQTAATASGRARQQARDELEGQLQEQLSRANRYYHEELKQKAIEKKVFPSLIQFSSSGEHVLFSALLALGTQPGAAADPPPLDQPHVVQGSAHESLANNLADTLLGGKVVEDKDFARFLQNVIGDVPRQYRLGTHMETWSTKLAKQHPLRFEFREGLINVWLHATDFVRGDRQIHFPVVVSAQYRPGITRFGVNLRRVGELKYAKPNDGESFAKDDQEMLAFVKKKVDALFSADIYFHGLVAPPGGTWDKLSKFTAREVRSDKGWFMFGIDLPDDDQGDRPMTCN